MRIQQKINSPDGLKHTNERWVTDIRKKRLSQRREGFWFRGFCFLTTLNQLSKREKGYENSPLEQGQKKSTGVLIKNHVFRKVVKLKSGLS